MPQRVASITPRVTALEIENFRGIRRGEIEGFRGINILVGKNGSGKSSVLEALLLALSLGDAIELVVRRRGWFGLASVDSLFYHEASTITIRVELSKKGSLALSMQRAIPRAEDLKLFGGDKAISGLRTLHLVIHGAISGSRIAYIDSKGEAHIGIRSGPSKIPWEIAFIDWNDVLNYGSPEEAYSDMLKQGGHEAKELVLETIREKYGDIVNIEPLLKDGKWVLHVVYRDHAIPFYTVGDGIKYTLVYLMHLASLKDSVLLLEEPELHQHPSLLELLAKAIVRSHTRRGNQIFISTHSLELIDMILDEAERQKATESIKVYRLALKAGKLTTIAYTPDEATKLRKDLDYDLRG